MPNGHAHGDSVVTKFDLTTAHGWKDLFAKWLFQQGVPTILLFAILVGGWYGIPQWQLTIKEGYREIQEGFSADLKMITDQMDKDGDKDRLLFERLLQEVRANRQALEKLPEKEIR